MAAPLARLALCRAQQLISLRAFRPLSQQWACLQPSCSGRRGWGRGLAAAGSGGAALSGGSNNNSQQLFVAAAEDATSSEGSAIEDCSSLEDGQPPTAGGKSSAAAAAAAAAGGGPALEPGLYIVSTPIGNLEDITLRALRVLRSATMVLAEDTRHTRQLFAHFGIRTPLHSFHQHNERQKQALVLRQLQQGAAIALVSDAGTPAINDPGADLVSAAAAAGLPVYPVPGPSAVLAALVGSGLPTAQFLYCGFVAAKAARRKQFAALAGQQATLVFFASPHALLGALEDAAEAFGPERRCCLARELTKRHEEFWRGSLQGALAEFAERGPRGEFVLLVEGASEEAAAAAAAGTAGAGAGPVGEEQILAALREAVAAGQSPSSAAKAVAARLGQSRKLCYQLSLTLAEGMEA
ncbi:hypothetical protein ABPG75_013078 [Micractinium tetrahymenae]